MKRGLEYYKSLPYSLDVDRFEDEEDGKLYFRASYAELPQVKGVHEDRLLAIKLAKELFDSFIEAQLEWGEEIPEPDTPRFRKKGGLFKFTKVESSESLTASDSDGGQYDMAAKSSSGASSLAGAA